GEEKKAPQKRHCCYYCHKQVFKIYRHYTEVHKEENEVKKISLLEKKNPLRKHLLDKLRKKGDYIFNTQLKSENEEIVVCRQSLKTEKAARKKNVPCPHCLGYYSKLSIRHHIEKCMPRPNKLLKRVNIQAECRRLQNNIHQIASEDLQTKIFPILNDDDVTNVIRYDEACTSHGAQIRSNLRTLGRLILAIKELNPTINNLYEALDACYVDLIIKGIDKVAGLDTTSNLYKSPATAMLLSTELKKLSKLLHMEFIKKGDIQSQKRMEDLYTVFNLEFHVTINKKGAETQKINSRRKKTILPKTDQIARFRDYLENKIKYYINKLNEKYSQMDWMRLAEFTLVHLAVFNRKRPGETQRILIDDYKNYEIVGSDEITDTDLVFREQIQKWTRVKFTGKLGNNTALLIHRDIGFRAIDLILKYRDVAGVPKENKFVFGVPSQYRQQGTFQTCQLIRKLADLSGIENPELLRTRLLRQHLATETATSQVDDRLEGRVSDFMSHKRQIHKDFYVMTQKKDNITKGSQLLENFSSFKCKANVSDQNSKNLSDEDYSPHDDQESEEELTNEEINYAIARKHFHNIICSEDNVSKHEVKHFFQSHQKLYKLRTPHLIMQWIKGEQKKFIQEKNGITVFNMLLNYPLTDGLSTSCFGYSDEGLRPQFRA
ncbi:hypothetical protein NQ317_000558, partial [Molorchus minor]